MLAVVIECLFLVRLFPDHGKRLSVQIDIIRYQLAVAVGLFDQPAPDR